MGAARVAYSIEETRRGRDKFRPVADESHFSSIKAEGFGGGGRPATGAMRSLTGTDRKPTGDQGSTDFFGGWHVFNG